MRCTALLAAALLAVVGCNSDPTGPPNPAALPREPAPAFSKSCTVPGHSNGVGCEAAGQRVLAAAAAMAKVCGGGMSVQCGIAQSAFASALIAYEQTYDAYGHRDGCDVFGVDCSGHDLLTHICFTCQPQPGDADWWTLRNPDEHWFSVGRVTP